MVEEEKEEKCLGVLGWIAFVGVCNNDGITSHTVLTNSQSAVRLDKSFRPTLLVRSLDT
jgi:hypothetical protein